MFCLGWIPTKICQSVQAVCPLIQIEVTVTHTCIEEVPYIEFYQNLTLDSKKGFFRLFSKETIKINQINLTYVDTV